MPRVLWNEFGSKENQEFYGHCSCCKTNKSVVVIRCCKPHVIINQYFCSDASYHNQNRLDQGEEYVDLHEKAYSLLLDGFFACIAMLEDDF